MDEHKIASWRNGETIMTRTQQPNISKTRAVASAALTLIVILLGVAATLSAQAQTFTDLYNFDDGSSHGGNPYAGVLRDTKGNLYGTTATGGSSGKGVVFKLSTRGVETLLYSFTGGSDGGEPLAGLLRDSAGNFYGTAFSGGSSSNGVVFKLSKSGTETVLHNFAGGSSDGAHPWGGLIQDDKGNFYGTTFGGGSADWGTVFKLSKDGTETVLHTFVGGASDGEFPMYTSLVMDKAGNLYGVTSQGGPDNLGVAYKLSSTGKFTLLHGFVGGTKDGCYAYGIPAMDSKGNLYGTTYKCGSSNQGTVWKLSAKGHETVLHNFTGSASDGAYPYAGVIMDAEGTLYSDTAYGGSSGDGAVYELNTKGKLTLLHSFDESDGGYPISELLRDAKGTLYGTAYEGGSSGYGTVWSITK
jgi:uncharacterized repeat protein (TIGR03803 family)